MFKKSCCRRVFSEIVVCFFVLKQFTDVKMSHVAPLIWSLIFMNVTHWMNHITWNLSALMSDWPKRPLGVSVVEFLKKGPVCSDGRRRGAERTSCYLLLVSSDSFNKTSQDNSCSSQWHERLIWANVCFFLKFFVFFKLSFAFKHQLQLSLWSIRHLMLKYFT